MPADNNVEQNELARKREFRMPESFARRQAGALALVAGLALVLAANSKDSDVIASSSSPVSVGRVMPPPSVSAPVTYEELAAEEPPEIVSESEFQDDIFDEVLNNASPQNRELAILQIKAEGEKYEKKDYKEEVDYKQTVSALENYGEYIRLQAEEKGLDPRLLIGMMYTESRGDPNAVSEIGAAGLFQIREDVARFHGYDPNDRFDPYINAEIAAVHMQYLNGLFGNVGIAMWAFHAGEGNVMRALEYYREENIDRYQSEDGEGFKNKPGDYEATLGTKELARRLEIEEGLREVAQSISVYDLLNSESVKTNVIETLQLADDTTEYINRIKAAARYYGDWN